MSRDNEYITLCPSSGRVADAARSRGMKQAGNGWYGYYGMFGVEIGTDGSWRAVGPENRCAEIAASEPAAAHLILFFAPCSNAQWTLVESGEVEEALTEANNFVGAWNLMVPGTEGVVAAAGAGEVR